MYSLVCSRCPVRLSLDWGLKIQTGVTDTWIQRQMIDWFTDLDIALVGESYAEAETISYT